MRGGVAVVVLVLAIVAGCGDGGGASSSGCGPDLREALDSNLGHVLPGAPPPSYLSDPPTSGPHQPGRALTGVLDAPIARPIQVGLLEVGSVLIQYKDISAAHLSSLGALASDTVVVAPNPDLHDPIVATAWLHKETCSAVDTPALQRFVADHVGKGAGTDQ